MSATPADEVDHIVEAWRRERPDLDVEPLDAMGYLSTALARIGRRGPGAIQPIRPDVTIGNLQRDLAKVQLRQRRFDRQAVAEQLQQAQARLEQADELGNAGRHAHRPGNAVQPDWRSERGQAETLKMPPSWLTRASRQFSFASSLLPESHVRDVETELPWCGPHRQMLPRLKRLFTTPGDGGDSVLSRPSATE